MGTMLTLLLLALGSPLCGGQPQDAATPDKRGTLGAAAFQIERREVADAFARSSSAGKPCASDAKAYLERASRLWSGLDESDRWPLLVEDGERLIQAGCDDALVRAAHAQALNGTDNHPDALPALRAALTAMQKGDYPPARLAVLAGTLGANRYATDPENAVEPFRISTDTTLRLMTNVAPERRTYLLAVLRPLAMGLWPESVVLEFVERARATEGCDPWLREMLAGTFHLHTAWAIRGGGVIGAVRPEALEKFADHNERARTHLTAAHALAPEYPYAATNLIGIVTAVGPGADGLEMDHWFEQATAAQFDYMPAYAAVLNGLRPRWGGSLEAMYGFGVHCAQTERYDTDVPRYYITAVVEICKEVRDFERIFRSAEVCATMREVLTGLTADPAHAASLNADKSLLAAVAWRCGEYAQARRLMEELGDRFDWGAAREIKADFLSLSEDPVLFTCGVKEAFLEARKAYTDGRWEEAHRLSVEAQEQASAEPQAVREAAREWVSITRVRASFESGAWTDLLFDDIISGWAGSHGRWERAGDDRTVRGTPTVNGLKCTLRADVGMRWELEGTIQFEPPLTGANAGIVFGHEDASDVRPRWMSWLLHPDQNLAAVRIGFTGRSGEAAVRTTIRPGPNSFRLRVFDAVAAVELNGEEIYRGRMPRDPLWRPGTTIGLGGYYSAPAPAVIYSKLRIRKLVEAPDGMDAAPAPPTGAPGEDS